MNYRFVTFIISIAWCLAASCNAYAQARVGPNVPQGKTPKPAALPVQHYAVVDLSGPTGYPDSGNLIIAIDDNLKVAFAYEDEDATSVQTFENGVLKSSAFYPSYVAMNQLNHAGDAYYTFERLRTTGEVGGSQYVVGQGTKGCFCLGSNITLTGRPSPFSMGTYTDVRSYTNIEGISANKFSYQSAYVTTDIPGDTERQLQRDINVISTMGKTYICGDDLPAILTDHDNIKYIHEPLEFYEVTDSDLALVYGHSGYYGCVWDGQQVVTAGMMPAYDCYSLNNQGWCLMDTDYRGDGRVWHAGTNRSFTELIVGTVWEHQLQQIHPICMSNENTTTDSVYAVASLKDGGNDELTIWKGQPSTNRWQPYRMQLPEGATIDQYADLRVTCNGVILAVGNPGLASPSPGDGHVLLLVPIGIRLYNGFTSNFDGMLVTLLITPPDNPPECYTQELPEQLNDPKLGPKPIGEGRSGGNGCYYDTLVAAKLPKIAWLHFRWRRLVSKIEWNIRKNKASTGWSVTWRNSSGEADHDDGGNQPPWCNDTPATERNEIYNWDDSGLREVFDYGTGFPDIEARGDAYSSIKDYVYSEKKFTYKIEFSIGGPDWIAENATWQDGVTMYASQRILVQQVKKTGIVTEDWKSIQNVFVEGNSDPMIDEAKTRGIVNGNLPITISSDANSYLPLE